MEKTMSFAEMTPNERRCYCNGVILGLLRAHSDEAAKIIGKDQAETEKAVKEIILYLKAEEKKQQLVAAQELFNNMKNDEDDNGSSIVMDQALSSIRSLLMDVQKCNENGHIIEGGRQIDDAWYNLPAGVKASKWSIFTAISKDGKQALDMGEYQKLSDEEKKNYDQRMCANISQGTDMLPVYLRDEQYVSLFLTEDMKRHPGVAILYASLLGKNSSSHLTGYANVVINGLRARNHILWSEPVIKQIDNGEIQSVQHLALAMLEFISKPGNIPDNISEQEITDCLTLLNAVCDPQCFADDVITSYRNNNFALRGCRKGVVMDATTDASADERRKYVVHMVKSAIEEIMPHIQTRGKIFDGKNASNYKLCNDIIAKLV